MSANTEEFNLFFPLNEINPQGWLNDFITPQVMAKKDSVSYSMIYGDYNYISRDSSDIIKSKLEKEKLFESYKLSNNLKYENEQKFIYLNGRYADILENNATTKQLAQGTENDNQEYLLFLNQIKPHQMAFIQPYVKLYYGWRDNPKSKEPFNFVEFPFSQNFQLEEILSPSNAFLEGSGIKSVSNKTQFSIGLKRNCAISINYYFGNMNVLTKKRDVEVNGKKPAYGFSFMKIMSNTSIKKELLKLEYGYHVDPTLEHQHHIPVKICNLINQREVRVIGLQKTAHNFKFNKEGGIEISVNYVSIAESYFESTNSVAIPSAEGNANIKIIGEVESKSRGALDLLKKFQNLKNELGLTKQQIEEALLLKVNLAQETSKNKSQTDSLVKLKQKRVDSLKEKEIDLNKELSLIRRQMVPYFRNSIVDTIKNNFDLYSISFGTQKSTSGIYSINAYLNLISPGKIGSDGKTIEQDGKEILISELSSETYSDSVFSQRDSYPQVVKSKLSGILNRLFNTPKDQPNSNTKNGNIVFFTARALFRAMYQMLDEEEKKLIPHILFGNLTARVYDNIYNINAGNVLIELNSFQKWMHDNFYSKGVFDFSFGLLLKKVVDELIPDALYRNKTFPQNTNRITVQDYLPNYFISKEWNKISAPKLPLKYRLENFVSDVDMQELCTKISNKYNDKLYEPLIIFSKLDVPTLRITTANNFAVNSIKQLSLSEVEDAKNGIPHLIIGADGGMFMSADFSQIDLPGLRTAVALGSMTDENSSYFFYKYNLRAQVFGSSIFNHGSIICIPTPPLGLSGEYDIGIVGYYKVKSLEESIDSSGKYTANVSADFFYNGQSANRGKDLSPGSSVKATKLADIKDFIGKDTYSPAKYIDLVTKTDINSLTNFGIASIEQTPTTKQPKKEEEKGKKTKEPVDSSEKDVPSKVQKAKSKRNPAPAGSAPSGECGPGMEKYGVSSDGKPLCRQQQSRVATS